MTDFALIRQVARRAVEGSESLTPTDRINLYRGLALILPTQEEKEAARLIATQLEELERAQLSLFEKLTGGQSA